MIILDEDVEQQPKLPNDPIPRAASSSQSQAQGSSAPPRPARPASPSLPDYETSQAEHRLLHRLRARGKRGKRFCKALLFATVLYLGLFVVIGIPLIVLKIRHAANWHAHGPFDSSTPGPPMLVPVIPQSPILYNGSLSVMVGQAVECNTWRDNKDLPTFPGSPALATAILEFVFPPEDIVIRANTTVSQSKLPHFTPRFELKMNPNESVSDVVMRLNVQYSRASLFHSINACLTKSNSSSGLGLTIPKDISPSDKLSIDVSLLLPKTTPPLVIDQFSTYLPAFEQTVGDLAPYVSFSELGLEGPMSNISISSVKASTAYIQASGGEISGTFNITESLSLDTINAPITADVSLVNDGTYSKPTYLSLDTGNGPIHATLELHAASRHFWIPQKYPDFVTRARTFNAPLELSVAHAAASKPARHQLQAHNTQGAVNVTLDAMFAGTFDVETKSAIAFVDQVPDVQAADAEGEAGDGEEEAEEDEGWNMQMDRVTQERMLGWIGWGKRPRGKERQGHVTIASSLSDVTLRVVRPGT
ncbi:hypothetical protein DENSPDRAFT_932751 [Dentipellis sp. KUC8613]|nr:hypothetical protein DENSPDRAFT_932751 [Dentipellis sp. KUC8613]